MKAIKILSLVMALLMLTAVFAACGSYNKPSSVFADYVDETPTYTTATQLSVTGSIFGEIVDGIAVMQDTTAEGKDVVKLVDVLGNKMLVEFTDTDTLSYSLEVRRAVEECYAILTTIDSTDAENIKTTYTMYDKNGVQIATSDAIESYDIYTRGDLIAFGKSIYRVNEEGVITLAFERKAFEGRLPEISYFTEENYVYVNWQDGEIFFYDTEMNLCGYWKAPSHINLDHFTAGALANGKVLAQYIIILPADAKDYDVFENGQKKDLVTLVIDTDGDADEYDSDYVFADITGNVSTSSSWSEEIFEYFDDSIENLAMGFEIVDGFVDWDTFSQETYVISGNGKVKGAIEIHPQQIYMDNFMPAAPLADGVYCVVTSAMQMLLVNGSGDLIADITGILDFSGSSSPVNECYLISDTAIYDFSMNKLFDLEEKEMTVDTVYDRSIILEDKDGKLYLFNGGAEPALIDGDDKTEILREAGGIFAVKKTADDGKVTYTYYNDLGNAVLSDSEIYLSWERTVADGAAVILSGVNAESKTVYYIFK